MDLNKIGNFISECRKNKGLTQVDLANKLFITDRAVSKWERGISLPDPSIMLKLCNILDINVNELLLGEHLTNDKDKTNELLIKLAKQDEIKNKKLYLNMWILGIVITIFYIAICILATYAVKKDLILELIIGISTLIFVLTAFYLVKIEIDAGYYECKNCHNKFIPKYIPANIAPHMLSSRYLKCPKCKKRTWAKKVMTK